MQFGMPRDSRCVDLVEPFFEAEISELFNLNHVFF